MYASQTSDIDKWVVAKITVLEELVFLLFKQLLNSHKEPMPYIQSLSESFSNSIYTIDKGVQGECIVAQFDSFLDKNIAYFLDKARLNG